MAYSYQVPVEYTIGISLTATPSGLAGYNTNSIALFSNEAPAFSESFKAYFSADEVATDFGSSSLTYAMAQGMFTPAPNLRTGDGVLYVFPYTATDATSAKLTTVVLTSKVTAFSSVTNGALKLTIDGTATEVTGMNFTGVTSVDDIAQILNNQNLDVYIYVESNKIVFKSKRYGTASSVSFGTAGSGTDIAGASYLNGTGATSDAGTNASGTTLADAVTAALQQQYFGGVVTTQYTEDTLLTANAGAIQAKDCVYFESISSLKDICGVGASLKTAGDGKTRLLAYSAGAKEAKVAIATYASIAMSVNYEGANTANTMNLKTLTGVAADTGLSDTYVQSAKTNGVDIYGNTGGLSVVYSNNNNGYTDDIVNDLWLKKALEVAGFNYLRQTNTKIPQTEQAMTGLKNAYAAILEQAIRNGVIAPGGWNGSIPFGDPESFKQNIAERGYYIYSLPVAKQAQTEREARKAPVIQIAVKRSGAIHFSNVIINVEA